MSRTGGRILVDQLALHGAELAFGVPGESYIDVLDALRDSPVRFVTCRHEAGAANMAEAYGKLTGRPGICTVTRGPGATQASVGVHTAFQDGTPLILLVGQIPRDHAGREAFQELDYTLVFGSLAKWVAQIDHVERIPELLARAFRVATSGRPGPVVLALPEDVLAASADVPDASPYCAGAGRPDSRGARRHAARCWREPSVRSRSWAVSRGARRRDRRSPTGARRAASPSRRRGDARTTSTTPPPATPAISAWVSIPPLRDRLRDADVLLVVGARLGDIETGGLRDDRASGRRPHADPRPPGSRRARPRLRAGARHRRLRPAVRSVARRPRAAPAGSRGGALDAAHEAYLATLQSRALPGDVELTGVMEVLRDRLDADAILTSGAGNFTVWAHRFYVFRRYRTQLAPLSGAMGYGVPAAIAAKLVHPERDVVCLAGDGDFLMSAHELATARQFGAPIVVLVVDNGMYGTIRMHQERRYPGRVSGTDLLNPDFAALADAFGCHAERVERTADFAAALDRALAADVPAVVHLPVDPEALTPRLTLTEIRAGGRGGARTAK